MTKPDEPAQPPPPPPDERALEFRRAQEKMHARFGNAFRRLAQ